MRLQTPVIISFILLSGCGAFDVKEKVGDYVTAAAMDSIERKLETAISARGVEVSELKASFLADKEGRISPQTILENAKSLAKDYAASEVIKAQAILTEKLTEFISKESGKTKEELESIRKEIDKDKDGLVSKSEFQNALSLKISETTNGMKSDTQALVDRMISNIKSGAISKEDFEKEISTYKADIKGRVEEFWQWLIGSIGAIIVAYASKQVVSAKGKADVSARLEMIERLTGMKIPVLNNTIQPTNGNSNGQVSA